MLLLMHRQRNWFLETESTPGEGAVIIDNTIKVLKYYKNLVDQATVGFKV